MFENHVNRTLNKSLKFGWRTFQSKNILVTEIIENIDDVLCSSETHFLKPKTLKDGNNYHLV